MPRVTDGLMYGGHDEMRAAPKLGVGGLLCVAPDKSCEWEWPCVEFMQVGIADGPGNELADYCAAVLALSSLMRKHDLVLVFDHEGKRALAVCIMYLCLARGRRPAGGGESNNAHCWTPWQALMLEVEHKLGSILKLDKAHISAYDTMPYALLEVIRGRE